MVLTCRDIISHTNTSQSIRKALQINMFLSFLALMPFWLIISVHAQDPSDLPANPIEAIEFIRAKVSLKLKLFIDKFQKLSFIG